MTRRNHKKIECEALQKYREWFVESHKRIKPIFKVGDCIQFLGDGDTRTVIEVRMDCYALDDYSILNFTAQSNWALADQTANKNLEAEIKNHSKTTIDLWTLQDY